MQNSVVVIIDDDPDMIDIAKDEILAHFDGNKHFTIAVTGFTDFDNGLRRLLQERADLVVLDVRQAPTRLAAEEVDRGRSLFEELKDQTFLPVVFWTGLPAEVRDLEAPPLITVLSKDEQGRLGPEVEQVLAAGAGRAMRAIEDRVAGMLRQHLWNELVPHWEEYGGHHAAEAVLVARLAHTLYATDLPELLELPSQCYLYPPVSDQLRPGDLFRENHGGVDSWFVVLTPACDLAHSGKAEFVLLAQCVLLADHPRWESFQQNDGKGPRNQLHDLLSDKLARYQYLPAFRDIPHLLVDFEQVSSRPTAQMDSGRRVSALVSPFAEGLVNRHSHFRGRIGTPDLPVDATLTGFDEAKKKASSGTAS